MKNLIFILLLVVALFLVGTGLAAADGEYTRIVIPKLGVSAAIQPLEQQADGGWPEPNHFTAWCLDPESFPGKDCLQAIYMHRANHGFDLGLLKRGDLIYLYEDGDWVSERQPLQLQIFGVEIVPEDEEPLVLGVVGGDVFALITCHPPDNLEAPERLVVWAEIDHGPRWAYVLWGDSLSRIARRYGVSVGALARANAIYNRNFVQAGTWLKIP